LYLGPENQVRKGVRVERGDLRFLIGVGGVRGYSKSQETLLEHQNYQRMGKAGRNQKIRRVSGRFGGKEAHQDLGSRRGKRKGIAGKGILLLGKGGSNKRKIVKSFLKAGNDVTTRFRQKCKVFGGLQRGGGICGPREKGVEGATQKAKCRAFLSGQRGETWV